MQTKLKPIMVALALALAANSHALWAADENKDAAQDEKSSADTRASEPATTELPAIQVRGTTPEKSYVEPVSSAATRTDAPVIDTPVSISTATRTLMDDRQVQSLQDVVQSTSGVVDNRDPWGPGFQDAFNIRGFDDPGSGYYYDGLRMDALTAETDNLEEVDIAKGPASALYGNESSEGGVVNLSVKKPKATAHYMLKGTSGSFGYFKGVADATGPLNESKTLRYRFVGISETEGSYVDQGKGDRKFAALSLEWVPSEATRVLLRHEYDKIKVVPSESQPVYSPTGIINMPINVNIIAPADYNTTLNNTRLDWSHVFDSGWKISQRNQYDSNAWDYKVAFHAPALPVTSVAVAAFGGTQSPTNEAHNIDLTGTVATGSVIHKLLLGADYRRFTTDNFTGFMNFGLPAFDFTHPNYAIDWAAVIAGSMPFASVSEKWVKGLYFQDMASLNERLRLMLGGRFDDVRSRSGWAGPGTLADAQALMAAQDGRDHAFSPRVGLLYKLRPDWSVYTSYAEGFSANNGFGFGGVKLDPVHTKSYEVGTKNEYFDGKASSSIAIYQIIKSNMLLPDPAHGGFSVNSGHVKSQGVDFDLTGKLTDHLSTTAVLGYNSIFTLDNGASGLPAGSHLANSRAWRGSIWTKYQLGSSEDQGLNLGGGIFFASPANLMDPATYTNLLSYQNPAWVRTDLSASYGWKEGEGKWIARLSVKNLFDKKYVDAYYYAVPRNLMATLEWER